MVTAAHSPGTLSKPAVSPDRKEDGRHGAPCDNGWQRLERSQPDQIPRSGHQDPRPTLQALCPRPYSGAATLHGDVVGRRPLLVWGWALSAVERYSQRPDAALD